ncbi:MAG: type II toxin-antitoxin system death-on-curing family toxin [Rhodothermia bacterium]|nr:MAG: type II toxin-antitoxin system death-on-curing family toxin [Rhodothermia bacterium]
MLHADSLRYFGGSPGLRDEALLESAAARPRNKWSYDQAIDIFELAVSYGFGLAKNHAFIDGNKRTALLSVRAFLFRNGYRFTPEEVETVTVIEGLADGTVDETLLSEWIEKNSEKS